MRRAVGRVDPVGTAVEVLAAAAAFDPMLSKPSEEMVFQWSQAFERAGVQQRDLLEAVYRVYLEGEDVPRNRLGTLVQVAREVERERVRAEREAREAAERARVEALPAGWVGRPVRAAYEARGAITRTCPTCGAVPEQPCSGEGGWRRMPHFPRITGREPGSLDR